MVDKVYGNVAQKQEDNVGKSLNDSQPHIEPADLEPMLVVHECHQTQRGCPRQEGEDLPHQNIGLVVALGLQGLGRHLVVVVEVLVARPHEVVVVGGLDGDRPVDRSEHGRDTDDSRYQGHDSQ